MIPTCGSSKRVSSCMEPGRVLGELPRSRAHVSLRPSSAFQSRHSREQGVERERATRRLFAIARVLVPCLVLALSSCSSGGGGGGERLTAIAVTPTNSSVASGTSRQLKATGLYTDKSTQDLTKQVTWSSSDTRIVTVDQAGVVRGVRKGTAVVTATSEGKFGTANVKVQ